MGQSVVKAQPQARSGQRCQDGAVNRPGTHPIPHGPHNDTKNVSRQWPPGRPSVVVIDYLIGVEAAVASVDGVITHPMHYTIALLMTKEDTPHS
jgi:hypothetical protein